MSFAIDVDVDELVAAIANLGNLIDAETAGAVRDVSRIASERARALAPQGRSPGAGLRSSIDALPTSGSFLGETLEGGFGAGASYASYVELGTNPHAIGPVRRKALRWPSAGFIGPLFVATVRRGKRPRGKGYSGYTFAKSVDHPGTRPQPFLRPAAEGALPLLRSKLDVAITLAIRKAGLG